MTTDLKNTTPREARLGRWVLLYGILQTLSTLSVDVQSLKHTDGVRYHLCTDLKRCPEWVTNGHLEYLEASQKRSWCWQRSWDPSPTRAAPAELEANQSNEDRSTRAPLPDHELSATRERERDIEPLDLNVGNTLDGETLTANDIHRLNEKISSLALPPNSHARDTFTQNYTLRRENEKAIQSDFRDWKPPRFDSLPQQHSQPHPPHPTPVSLAIRSPNFPRSDFDFTLPLQGHSQRETRGTMGTDLGGHPFSAEDREQVQWPVPPGYTERGDENGRAHVHRESGIGYSVSVSGGGGGYERGLGDVDRRSPRRMYERGGWD